MRFVATLQPHRVEQYDEAARHYVRAVSPRAAAIYRVGSVQDPGVSDLDLLIVPKAAWTDNARYFSVFERIPADLHGMLRHEPHVLPEDSVDVFRYTTHRAPELLHGRDVLETVVRDDAPENDWPLLLEGLLHYRRFVRRAGTDGELAEGRLITRASSLRYSLRILDGLVGSHHAPPFEAALNELRGGFFELPMEERCGRAWELACAGARTLEHEIAGALPLQSGETAADFAGALLRKGRGLEGLDDVRLSARRAAVSSYHKKLQRLRFYQGSLFFSAAYRKRYRAAREDVLRYEAAAGRPPSLGR